MGVKVITKTVLALNVDINETVVADFEPLLG